MTNFKKLTITATLLTTLLSANVANAKFVSNVDKATEATNEAMQYLKELKSQKGHHLNCPNFEFNKINICKDEKNGATCYYVRADESDSMSLSCVKQ